MWLNDNEGGTVSEYIKINYLSLKMKDYLSLSGRGWREPERRVNILKDAKDKLCKKLSVPRRAHLYISKYPEMEKELILQLRERRGRKARDSAVWIHTTSKKIARVKYPNSNFVASNGWLFRFLKCHEIKLLWSSMTCL